MLYIQIGFSQIGQRTSWMDRRSAADYRRIADSEVQQQSNERNPWEVDESPVGETAASEDGN